MGKIKNSQHLILGGGISGMGAAFKLHRAGVSFDVLEAGYRCGGVLNSITKEGFTLDMGANSAVLDSEMREFINFLGLADKIIEAGHSSKKRYLWQKTGIEEVRPSLLHLMLTSWLTWGAKLRLLSEPFRAKGPASDESVMDFVSRRLGEEIADKMVDPVFRGIYAGDIAQISAKVTMDKLKKGEQHFGSLFRTLLKSPPSPRKISSLEGGFSELSKSFEEKFGDSISRNTMVSDISYRDGVWHVEVKKNGETMVFTSERLISTIPLWKMKNITGNIKTELPAAIERIKYASIGVLHLSFKASVVRNMYDGFGILVPSGMKKKILGVMFNSRIFVDKAPQGQELITVFHREKGKEKEVFERIAQDLYSIFPDIEDRCTILGNKFWSEGIPQFPVGIGPTLEDLKQANRKKGLAFAGNYLGKVGVADAFQSGIKAADLLLESTQPQE